MAPGSRGNGGGMKPGATHILGIRVCRRQAQIRERQDVFANDGTHAIRDSRVSAKQSGRSSLPMRIPVKVISDSGQSDHRSERSDAGVRIAPRLNAEKGLAEARSGGSRKTDHDVPPWPNAPSFSRSLIRMRFVTQRDHAVRLKGFEGTIHALAREREHRGQLVLADFQIHRPGPWRCARRTNPSRCSTDTAQRGPAVSATPSDR